MLFRLIYFCFLSISLLSPLIIAEVVQLNAENIQPTLSQHELVLVNFYADWCHFSRQLTPVFEDTSTKLGEFNNQVKLGRIDCEAQAGLCQKYGVNKYPTIKLFRFSTVQKKEYRNSRNADSFLAYLREQIKDPIEIKTTAQDMKFSDKDRHVVGYFKSQESDEYSYFKQAASMLRDECKFHIMSGELGEQMLEEVSKSAKLVDGAEIETGKQSSILYYAPLAQKAERFEKDLTDFNEFYNWALGNCRPLVAEITFENAEELTEEGIPFLILFHQPQDLAIVTKFQQVVERELSSMRDQIKPVFADGQRFAHPLHHLGKKVEDLPVVAIDSFKHMYIYPHDVKTQMDAVGFLQFIADLKSGKLHREFHYGPDAVTKSKNVGKSTTTTQSPSAARAKKVLSPAKKRDKKSAERDGDEAPENEQPPPPKIPVHPNAPPEVKAQIEQANKQAEADHREKQEAASQPPKSTFQELKPSGLRYTILDHDEF